MRRAFLQFAPLALVAAIVVPCANAQSTNPASPGGNPNFLHAGDTSRIADPKLEGGGVRVKYMLQPAASPYQVVITAWQNGTKVATVFDDEEVGGVTPRHHLWDGKDSNGKYVNNGTYKLQVDATLNSVTQSVSFTSEIIRLGVTNIAAESSSTTTNEYQVVYFRKKGTYAFYATPSTSEWVSTGPAAETSELDLNDGTPRPAPAVHAVTDEPVMVQGATGNWKYDTVWHAYPLCYLQGTQPQFTATFGATCTDATGAQATCNYPVTGFDLRCVVHDESGLWRSSNNVNVAPGGTATFVGPPLTTNATRSDRHVEWRWQYRPTGTQEWSEIPGKFTTEQWIYTIINTPYLASGATGTQYAGPWAEILDYMYTWEGDFGITPSDDAHVVELLIKGYNGQPTYDHAIEGIEYDCPANGGDGGATHYLKGQTFELSSLLNSHALGKFVNCTDCAAGTSTILGMIGIQNVQMERLGSMTLRAIWGIGCDDYTVDLWGNGGGGGHGFSYHHIITRDAGVNISDACLWVDEDGHPNRLPGIPGFNNDRDWSNYESLLAKGSVSWQLDILPKFE